MRYRRRIRESLFRPQGQALVEYALILVLVVMAMAIALAATGPAISNVFSNTVYNLIGLSGTPLENIQALGGGANSFWATVTAVAANPQGETPFPTNPPAPPTSTFTPGPSPTPSPTVPTPTPSTTPTVPPTFTPTDFAFVAPFYDSVDTPQRWRLDSSVWIGGDDWKGEYYPNQTWSGTPDFVLWNQEIDPTYRWNLNFDWGTEGPISTPAWLTSSFSIRYTRQIYTDTALPVRFTASADGQVRVRIQTNQTGTPTDIIPLAPCAPTACTTTYTIPVGPHNLIVEYTEDTNNPAKVSLSISNAGGINVDDTALPSGVAECSWGQQNTNNANTFENSPFQWDSDTINQEFPTNRRCHLELRGYVDLSTLTTPKMTFWDYWDLSNNAGTKTYLEIAEYQPPPTALTWRRVDLHTGPTTNYNWTMQTVDLTNVAGTNFAGKNITFRFVMENGNNSTPARRWYIDDVLIDDFNTNRDFFYCQGSLTSCGSYWSLNDTAQTADFVASGRWELTANNVQSFGGGPQLSWDDSPGYPYRDNSEGNPRIHSLEFKGWINLSDIPASGTGGAPDADGDDGKPQLSFYFAYDIDAGDRLVLQYTRDPYSAGNGANWTDWVTLVDATGGRQTNITMQFKEQLLDSVPNWNTQRFRLRFALIVNGTNGTGAQGIWIDELYLEREAKPAFSPYPFLETAEIASDIFDLWRTEAQWGQTNASGVFGSAYSLTDSPTGNYANGLNSSIQLRGAIDLNNNTPENLTLYGGNKGYDGSTGTPANVAAASNRPYLTFWHWRALAANEAFHVEISNDDGANWTTIWSWDYLNFANSARQRAWERVEIDLQRGIEQMTGQTWNTISTNSSLVDDDILIRFRLDARSGSAVNDGIYLDNISVANYSEVSHKLWAVGVSPTTGGCSGTPNPPCGSGNGSFYDDDIEGDWWNRWYTGGNWSGVSFSNAQRSGLLGFHDSPPVNTNYLNETYSVLQMTQIIDLRGVAASSLPRMFFWTRYNLGNKDSIQVQISPENPASTSQTYERVARWDPWENPISDDRFETGTTGSMIGGPTSSGVRLDTWTRVQIDLSAYAGKRIRVRFVLDALVDGGNLRDGWFIDDVRFVLMSPPPGGYVRNLPFFDNAQNTQNWVVEGIWGLDAEKFRGSGGGPASLGPDPWYAYWFDCELSITPLGPLTTTGCSSTSRFNTLLSQQDSAADLPNGPYIDINFDFGSSGRPPGALSGAAGSSWDDNYGVRFERDIAVAAGQFTFITVSDDGVRLRYVTNATCAAGAPPNTSLPPSGSWNIINNWSYHGRTVDMRTITLPAGNHCLVLEWFEATGDAVIILTAGNNTFSYSDSPKLVAGTPAIDSVPFGNSALMLDGVLNLVGATSPALEFWTQYDLNSGNFARVEVSQDGGFGWEQTNLGTSGSCSTTSFCNPTIGSSSSDVSSVAGTWELRRHNLASYVGKQIGLRFRLTTGSGVEDGWWITDIQVNQ